ncbi:SRPBCC family protein [Demequina sediminicola]|uniref:SRPBCC family protein n=1 Tax=Demequina sediminicola TaxID=1095026 RepID=UPI000781601C|nr:SRPBCC family protein [Demequina sediminicola]
MKPRTVEVTRDIEAPPERVFEVLTDLDHATEVMSGILKVERLEGDGYEVGTIWRETRKMFGREASEVMEVTGIQAPVRTTVGSLSHGTYYTTEFHCEPIDSGTRLTCSFTGEPRDPSFVQKLGWVVFGASGMKATKKVVADDLADIASAAEGSTEGA